MTCRALRESVQRLASVNVRVLPITTWTYIQAMVEDGYGPALSCRFLEACLWPDLAIGRRAA